MRTSRLCLMALLFGAATTVEVLAQTVAAPAQEAPAPQAGAGDPEAGAHVFVKCRACHQIGDGAHNAVGPELNGLMGRHSASIDGYTYSDAMRASGLIWDEPTFRAYIRNPKAMVPGTKMSFPGLTRQSDVDNVTAYLKTFGPDGRPRP